MKEFSKPKMIQLNRYHIPICTDDEFHESRESRPFPLNDLKLTPCREGLVIFGTENSTLGKVGLEIREIFSLSVGREALKTSDGRATEPDSRLWSADSLLRLLRHGKQVIKIFLSFCRRSFVPKC